MTYLTGFSGRTGSKSTARRPMLPPPDGPAVAIIEPGGRCWPISVKAKSTTCEWRRAQPTVRVVQYTPASTVAPPTACAGRKRSPRSVVERSAVRTGTR